LLTLFEFTLSFADIAVIATVALLIGMSKTGVHGAGMLAVPMLATVFGGQRSSGIMLPILCLADVIGVWYYHRHAAWTHLKKLLPWALLGTLVGTVIGEHIDDKLFKIIMAVIIIISVVIMIWLERTNKEEDIPHAKWFAATTGVAGGFTSMVGNLAGSVMAVYFLSMRFQKNSFIGTTAWFFMIINWMKVPFHVWRWETINVNTFLLDLATLPLIIVGAYLGIIIVKRLPEKAYRWFIIGMTLLAAIMMFVRR
jgi:uncharacterized protein